MDPSLQPLLDTLSTPEFEERGNLAITSASWSENNVMLCLTIQQQEPEDQHWRLHCQDVRGSRISNDERRDPFCITTTHPLLLPHTEPQLELYFASRPSDPDAAVGRLIEAHRAVGGAWLDCFQFFNLGPNKSLRELLAGGFGKVADGPRSLVERYSEALRSCGALVSSPPPRPPVRWHGGNLVEQVEPLFAVILGSSYVISPSVTANRH